MIGIIFCEDTKIFGYTDTIFKQKETPHLSVGGLQNQKPKFMKPFTKQI